MIPILCLHPEPICAPRDLQLTFPLPLVALHSSHSQLLHSPRQQTAFRHILQLATKLWRWTAHEGLYLPKKKVYTRLSLSLLHWKREQEERLGGVGPWSIGPTTQLPFSANTFHTQLAYRSLFPVRGQHRLKRYLFQHLSWPYMIFKIFLSPYHTEKSICGEFHHKWKHHK